ncbi:transcriptional regulator [Rhizobium laguerreae]|uniref:transcriptional regulator n=1 Tax=Rhizobium laguerreae TaxID=1076926 RepID=UPI00103D8420|nr:transcriptional regulator [Rhizobium laguerreae]MBY3102476.1 transcriptional regulator [Rhizobium laguerreae]MBY3129932.1 transcriptional regulator [Rhizobium laguerreae]MBY3143635.1 transcriptional regulator [Rhizobium laguerreae]MBY3165501.1 transcriptional regulator [Rhizobium laguerreae]MBY3205962.1 transcriptional regulator [Rhizobium laguerreae]
MKKVQRSFAVEYKSGRRKLNSKPSSIWADTDLKSVAQDMEDEAMPFMSLAPQARSSEMLVSGEERAAPLLTLPIEQETNASALQETIMADEKDTTTNADTPAAAASDLAKKVRKPRANKVVPATASVAVSAEPAVASGSAVEKQKRRRKAKPDEGTTSAKRAPVKRAPKAVSIAAAPSVAAIDEIADLLQLEEENQRLRKLLAEKLRAENADLRKRLNLG